MQILLLLLVPVLARALAIDDPVHLRARAASTKTVYKTSTRLVTRTTTARPTTLTKYAQETSTSFVTTTLGVTTTVTVQQAKRAYAHKSARPTQKAKSPSKNSKSKNATNTAKVKARQTPVPTITKTKYVTSTIWKFYKPTVTKTVTKPGVVTDTITKTRVSTRTIHMASSSSLASPPSSIAQTSSTSILSSSLPVSSAPARINDTPISSPEVANQTLFRQDILSQHNNFRALFGVPALQWNATLAAFAQQWVNGCKYYHSIEEYGNSVPWYGENIAAAWSNSASYLSTFDSTSPMTWWANDEFKLYSYNPRTSRDDEATGHFQNVVWKSYTSVGCAVAYCPNGLTNDKNATITSDPSLYWSCDFGLNPNNAVSWSADYNIPQNITTVPSASTL